MDILTKCFENFKECQRLLTIESLKDPETEPHRSQYKARDMLLESKSNMAERLKIIDASHKDYNFFKSTLSILTGQIGLIYIETNEMSKAEEYLMDSLSFIDDHLDPYYVLPSIQARNSLGYLWSHRSQHTEARKWLEEAEKIYIDFKNNGKGPVFQFADFFDNEVKDRGEKELEKLHTMTKFYLAQVYGALKELLKSAIYCHETLKRELIYKEFDPIDWALNSATLSQVFMEKLFFKQARHHLAAASYTLDAYEETLKDMEGTQEEIDGKKEELRHRSADVSRCWAKYGILLLVHSKNGLTKTEEIIPEEKNEDVENLRFDSLDLTIYENQIVDSVVITFEDAREIFLITQKHLNKAKEYYTLEDRASDHVRIVQDHSHLFKHLLTFEPDEERQFKMMKKRVDMLELVLKELNPKYYLDVCRQLWFELGETYHDMMQIKFQKVKNSEVLPAPQALMKINTLSVSSMVHFNSFLDSLRDKKSKELPDPLPEEFIGSALIAHFYLGRLYYKYITQDKRKQIENTTKAYECFKYLVDYCEKSEKAKSIAGEEFNISKEMMTLLQMKALQL